MTVASGLNATTAAAPAPGADAGGRISGHSTWQSPVPYLFGGLAAMLGLIALALLILACSYWKLSGYLGSGRDGAADDEEDAAGGVVGGGGVELYLKPEPPCGYEEKIVVIMAGDEKPTFLATPMSSRASSFCPDRRGRHGDEEKGEVEESREKGNETQGKSQSHENQDMQV